MAKRSAPVTQSDVTRLIKGAVAAGVRMERITGVQLTRDGVVVLFGDKPNTPTPAGNEWDEVMK